MRDFVTLEEKPKSAETTISQIPVIHIKSKKEKEMLEKQYYALNEACRNKLLS